MGRAMRSHRLWLRQLAALALALACLLAGVARADTAITLTQTYAGNISFVGTQKTMRTAANGTGNPCSVVSSTTPLVATLSGIPAGATILSAHLYWAGSSTTSDYDVNFEGTAFSAPANRRYTSTTNGYTYFSGAVDVTAKVVAKGNGNYTFFGLTINSGTPYCAVEGVMGGWSLLAIYSEPSETYRVLNVFEGFQFIHNNGLTLNLSNFRIPNPIGSATGRISHITWEGDATLDTTGEDLLYNNVEMTDSINPVNNQFNSTSNINADPNSWGIDFDAYTVGSPVILADQTSAQTRYQSGQDLVLLSAEIIAVPNVPVADLAVAMTIADNPATLGQGTSYTITVTNNGPNAETGPIVVTDTLPSVLTVTAAGGDGWICNVTGQTVTCTSTGSLAVGASLPSITLAVTVTQMSTSTVTNTASVSGQMFDNVSANNSASVSITIGSPAYVFTDSVCVRNIPFGDPDQPCNILTWGAKVAGTPVTGIYMTYLNVTGAGSTDAGTPIRVKSSNTTVSMQFAFSCHNPTTNTVTQASFPNISSPLPVCATNGATPTTWGPTWSVAFLGNSPTSTGSGTFTYEDVGRVELFLKAVNPSGTGSSGTFVSKPAQLAFTSIQRVTPLLVNPAATTGAGAAFVRAGEAFTISAASFSSTGAITPNFGNETIAQTISLTQEGAIDPGTSAVFTDMTTLPALNGSFGAINAGVATGSAFSWDEVGILKLTPTLTSGDYLGTGAVTSVAANVGRFYPDHFDTATTAPMTCLTNMVCPVDVSGAAYSAQAAGLTITARNAGGATAQNYRGVFARDVTISALDTPGSATVPALPAGATLTGASVPATGFTSGVANAAPAYGLPTPFVRTSPRALDWSAPASVYYRAAETSGDGVTSLRAAGTVEGGLRIVNGRLQLANAYGSELLNMPIRMKAQYWTGAGGRWENSTSDSASVVVPTVGNISYGNCLKNLADASPDGCKDVFFGTSVAPITLAGGAATFRLSPVGAGNTGSVELWMTDPGNPAWLPSTIARIVFGVYKSPLIFIREVY